MELCILISYIYISKFVSNLTRMYDIQLSGWLSGSWENFHNMSLRFLGYSLSLEKGYCPSFKS